MTFARRLNLALIGLFCFISTHETHAQFLQQGNKLVGTGAVGSTVFQGISVSLSSDGNTAIVGGENDINGAGAAWVWTRSGGVWTQQGAKLVGTGATGESNQGASVSLSSDGNTAIVGGYGDNSYAGAAWVWIRTPPAFPILVSPANNAAAVPIATNLIWNRSSGAATYRVQLSTDSTFATAAINDSTVIDTTRSAGTLLNNTVYYWRVNAKNSAGTSAYSARWKFTTATVGISRNEFGLQRLNFENSQSLRFNLPTQARVTIRLYDSKGAVVKTLLDEVRSAGDYSQPLPKETKTNSYLLDFKAGEFHKTMKLNL